MIGVLAAEAPPPAPATGVPRPSGNPAGMPGGQVALDLLNYLHWSAVVVCLAVFIWGGATLALASRRGSGTGTNRGRELLIGGGLGAVAIAAAPEMLEWGMALGQRII